LEVINDLATSEAASGVLVCACGFVADHLEVLYDLDIEAKAYARERNLAFDRTACVNDDATIMAALAQRVVEAAGQFTAS
jgi:ferrochelatase